MNKEDLIKLLENINVVEVVGFNLTYFDKEDNRYDSKTRELRTINYGFNLEHELQSIRRNIDYNYESIHRDINYMIEEKIREKEGK